MLQKSLRISLVLVTQSCPTLCNPTDCSPPGSSVHEIVWARIPQWVGSHSLLQGIFPIQGSNPGLSCSAADSSLSEPPGEAWPPCVCRPKLLQSCPCDSKDCSLPGSSLHGILHGRILEWGKKRILQWVAIFFFRGSS